MRSLSLASICGALLLGGASSVREGLRPLPGEAPEFTRWAEHYRAYSSTEERVLRHSLFAAAAAQVAAHNAQPGVTWRMSTTGPFADLTPAEFKARFTGGYRPRARRALGDVPPSVVGRRTRLGSSRASKAASSFADAEVRVYPPPAAAAGGDALSVAMASGGAPRHLAATPSPTPLPGSLDWRTAGAVTPVKDQGACGSCWTFSVTGSLEGVGFLATGVLTSLSEQQLTSCSNTVTTGNLGCSGGNMIPTFQWIADNGGICTQSAYPYTSAQNGVTGTCASSCTPVATVGSVYAVTSNSESALMDAVTRIGPIAVSVEASQNSFQYYSSGVLTSACGSALDHAITLVGFGGSVGNKYWLAKNQWGTSWGEAGYIRLGRGASYNGGAGQCGILGDSSFATYISLVPVSPTPSPSVAASRTISGSVSKSRAASPSFSATSSASASVSPSVAATPSVSPSTTASVSASGSTTPSTTMSGSTTPSLAASTSVSASVSPSASISPSVAATRSLTPSTTATSTVTPSISPSPSSTTSVSPTGSASPSGSSSATGSASVSPSVAATPSVSPTIGATASVSPSVSCSPSASASIAPQPSNAATILISIPLSISMPSAAVLAAASPDFIWSLRSAIAAALGVAVNLVTISSTTTVIVASGAAAGGVDGIAAVAAGATTSLTWMAVVLAGSSTAAAALAPSLVLVTPAALAPAIDTLAALASQPPSAFTASVTAYSAACGAGGGTSTCDMPAALLPAAAPAGAALAPGAIAGIAVGALAAVALVAVAVLLSVRARRAQGGGVDAAAAAAPDGGTAAMIAAAVGYPAKVVVDGDAAGSPVAADAAAAGQPPRLDGLMQYRSSGIIPPSVA